MIGPVVLAMSAGLGVGALAISIAPYPSGRSGSAWATPGGAPALRAVEGAGGPVAAVDALTGLRGQPRADRRFGW